MIGKLSSHLGPSSLFSGGAASSLVLYLDAGNTYSYPGTGSTWYDLSSYNNDGVFQYTPIYSTDWEGYIGFDGITTQNQLGFPGLTAIPIGDSHYTIEAWVKSELDNGGILAWGNYNTLNSYNALRYNGDRLLNYWWSNDLLTNNLGMTSSIFYHIVAKYDGTNREIWLNGEMVAQDTPGTHSVSTFNNLSVGVSSVPLSEFLNGGIGALKIYNKSLSSNQILSSYVASRSRFGYEYGSFTFSSSSNQYLYSSSTDYIIGTNDFTIEAFVKTFTQSGFDGVISLSPQSTQIGPRINISSGVLEFWTSNSGGPYNTFTMSNNTWYHLAMSRNAGTVSCFVNGNMENQFYDNSNFTHQNLVIGRYYTDTDNHYIDGLISGVRLTNGVSIYNSNFSIPEVLNPTSSTVLLLKPLKNNPLFDSSGMTHSVQGTYGWTSSLPSIYEFYYPDFSSTTGLDLISVYQVTGGRIYLTDLTNSDVGNVYYSTAKNYNRNFALEFNFECSGGSGADGFCVQWTTTNNSNGGVGGDVGGIYSAHNLLQFRTWSNNNIQYWHNNSSIDTQSISPFTFRQNAYYWMDYNYSTSTMNIYYSTTYSKPGSPSHTFTSFTFDGSNYYLGFGASNGGSTDSHVLKSMKLVFN